MRRRRLLVVLAGLAVVVAVGVVVLWPQEDRITQENYDRIRVGMSWAEVYAVLGPPGDYRNGPTEELVPWIPSFVASDVAPDFVAWQGDHGMILVYRKGHGDPAIIGGEPDDPDSVWGARFVEVRRVQQGPIANLIWRAKRQWRRWFPE